MYEDDRRFAQQSIYTLLFWGFAHIRWSLVEANIVNAQD